MINLSTHAPFPSDLVVSPTVNVWTPAGIAVDNGPWPVIYINDGQNLFGNSPTMTGAHWGVAETMTRLIGEERISPAIIVGIWHVGQRAANFVPCRRVDTDIVRSDTADAYVTFCAEELRPFINDNYPTLSTASDTYFMGASLGAIGALTAVCMRPDVFSGAACLSTHWPTGHGVCMKYFAEAIPPAGSHRFYFDFGSESLDSRYGPYQKRIDDVMISRGYRAGNDWLTYYAPGAEHNEAAWAERLHLPLEFLLGKSS